MDFSVRSANSLRPLRSNTPVIVGIPVSLTGQFWVQGRQTLAGIRAWVEDVNRRGGLTIGKASPRPARLVYYDDASNRPTVREVTKRLIVEDRVDVLIGPYSSTLTTAAAEVAREHGKLMWNQGGASPNVYRRGNPWIVGVLTPATDYLAGLLESVRRSSPTAQTLALVRAKTGAFPRDICSGVLKRASGLGFRTVLSNEFDAAARDFGDVVAEVNRAGPDVLIVAGRFQNDLLLSEHLASSDARVGAVAVVAAGVQQFHDRLGPRSERFIGPSQWEPHAGGTVEHGPTANEVIASLGRAGHTAVDYPMAQAYAVGVVARRCLEEAGTTDSPALRRTASAMDFSTFYGRFKIDATGRPTDRQALLVQWQHGRKVIVWPPESAQGELAYPWR